MPLKASPTRAILCMIALSAHVSAFAAEAIVIRPRERTNAVLHNPDMGWVLYENYALDPDPHGSSTLLTLPKERFDLVDAVALMFSWQDIEAEPDKYDFSRVDYAYDYWRSRGKEIQLRLSTTTLMWWANRNPAAGKGAPDYVLRRLGPAEKQVRHMGKTAYTVEDARNPFYRERLRKFLRAVGEHFPASDTAGTNGNARTVTLIDLRGFGAWGEWHSGFRYSSVIDRREALIGIIDDWCSSVPRHRLALSASYDPDGPEALHGGPTKGYDARFTTNYAEFLSYSAFDAALSHNNVTWRRDGCGGAVHSNERKLMEAAFEIGRGPFVSEFVDGYTQSKRGGTNWVNWKIEDALSLHPNYINLLGWQGADALAFLRERADLVANGLRRMGYRFVPVTVEQPGHITNGMPFTVKTIWVNRGTGRALRDYQMQLCLTQNGRVIKQSDPVTLKTSRWTAGEEFKETLTVHWRDVSAGEYKLGMLMFDRQSGRNIELPCDEVAPGVCSLGAVMAH